MESLLSLIFAKPSADMIVRQFDVLRFTKADLVDVATSRGIDTSGKRSAIAYRIANDAVARRRAA